MRRHNPPFYSIMMDEKNHLPLGDEQYTLILNTRCSPENCPEALRTFYAYLKDGTVAENDTLIRKIHRQVEHATQVEEVYQLMTVQEELDLREKRAEKYKAQAVKEENLTRLLLSENRIEDLKKALDDASYKEQLMREYGL